MIFSIFIGNFPRFWKMSTIKWAIFRLKIISKNTNRLSWSIYFFISKIKFLIPFLPIFDTKGLFSLWACRFIVGVTTRRPEIVFFLRLFNTLSFFLFIEIEQFILKLNIFFVKGWNQKFWETNVFSDFSQTKFFIAWFTVNHLSFAKIPSLNFFH